MKKIRDKSDSSIPGLISFLRISNLLNFLCLLLQFQIAPNFFILIPMREWVTYGKLCFHPLINITLNNQKCYWVFLFPLRYRISVFCVFYSPWERTSVLVVVEDSLYRETEFMFCARGMILKKTFRINLELQKSIVYIFSKGRT